MAADLSVHVKERCEECDGAGRRRVANGVGHVRFSKRVVCETCDGSGEVERWIALGELRALPAAEPVDR